MCDNFCANMYGFNASGYRSAAQHWASIPGKHRHPGDGHPPLGALAFWGGGSAGFGHVAIVVGAGKIRSTDMSATGLYAPGRVSTCSLSAPKSNWGLPYLGWADPYIAGCLVAAIPMLSAKPAAPAKITVSLSKIDYAARNHPKTDPGDVRVIQAALVAEHMLSVGHFTNGWYDRATLNAYSAWQHSHLGGGYTGAAADGIPGSASLKRLALRHNFNVAS